MSKRRRRRKYVMISVVAERFDIHPQTLRLYEREGLIKPTRSAGNTRLYDEETIERIDRILFLTRELGVNLAGVEVILNLREQMDQMQEELDRLARAAKERMQDRRAGLHRRHALVRVKRGALAKAKRR
ncbi:MAG: MerR family transcriptional regulator [Thermoanaerobaculia bacterium]|nr:MerR family transcriptional regulator [Thermoanaerobaculia bacterium]